MTAFDKYGFPEGSGIFTTIRTIDNHVIALNRHMRRVLKSADELGMKIADEETIRREIVELLSNQPYESGRLRLCFSSDSHHFSHSSYEPTEEPARITFWSCVSAWDRDRRALLWRGWCTAACPADGR